MPPCSCRRNEETLAQVGIAKAQRHITAKATHAADALATQVLAAHHRMEMTLLCP
jgi:hypothetical protein